MAKQLIREGADVNNTDPSGCTVLMIASKEGHTEIAELLIANGADMSMLLTHKGRTALMHSSEEGHTEIAEFLIANGADVNASDYDGRTALILASEGGHTETAELLIAKGAKERSRVSEELKDTIDNTTLTSLLQSAVVGVAWL